VRGSVKGFPKVHTHTHTHTHTVTVAALYAMQKERRQSSSSIVVPVGEDRSESLSQGRYGRPAMWSDFILAADSDGDAEADAVLSMSILSL
jgi:hypothetical protein